MKLLKWLLILLFLCVLAGTLFYSVYPDIARLKRVNPGKTAFMKDREQEWKVGKEGEDPAAMGGLLRNLSIYG